MTYAVLAACLGLTVFLAANAGVSLLAVLLWRLAERDMDGLRPGTRAAGLLLLRVLPVVSALVIVLGIFLPAFHAFEPRDTGESAGPAMLVLSSFAVAIVLAALGRGCHAARVTRRLMRGWLGLAQPLALPGLAVTAYRLPLAFPVVSLVGIVRPRLFVSDRVLEACTPEEVRAMVRHEVGHLASRDNLKRLVFRACPDLLAWLPAGHAIERAWQDAAEESADDYAVRTGGPGPLALAHALLKVARLVPTPDVALPLHSTFCSGAGFERRVRRLLADHRGGSRWSGWLMTARALALLPAFLTVAALLDPHLLRTVHAVLEAVVETLA